MVSDCLQFFIGMGKEVRLAGPELLVFVKKERARERRGGEGGETERERREEKEDKLKEKEWRAREKVHMNY